MSAIYHLTLYDWYLIGIPIAFAITFWVVYKGNDRSMPVNGAIGCIVAGAGSIFAIAIVLIIIGVAIVVDYLGRWSDIWDRKLF